MDINLQTKVADVLNTYPQLEEVLMEISPLFSKLKNPILRRTVAKITTLQQAADIAKISPPELIQALRKAVGLSSISIEQPFPLANNTDSPPTWLNKDKIVINYNASPVIQAGNSPMQEILKQASQLNHGEIMLLQAPFKPVPIIEILLNKGFKIWIEEEIWVFIYKQ